VYLRKYLFLFFVLLLLSGCEEQEINNQDTQKTDEVVEMDLTDKTAVMIIAPKNFRDEELLNTKEVLEKHGVDVIVASKGVSKATGSLGSTVDVDKDITNVKVNDYDAVIFVGGAGTNVYFNDETALGIARDSYELGKITAAICIAPVILANAGVLDGKKATVFSSGKDDIMANGADYTGEQVTQDGKVITGNGPAAARSFGELIAKELSKG